MEHGVKIESRQRVIVAMGGRIAERFASRPTERNALHESAHAVLACSFGWTLTSVTIRPDQTMRAGRRGSGYQVTGSIQALPARLKPRERVAGEPQPRLLTDNERIAMYAMLLTNDCTWRSALKVIRRLRSETRRLVDTFRPEISETAHELEHRGSLTGHEVLAICTRWGEATQV